jgi:hypothetical protein
MWTLLAICTTMEPTMEMVASMNKIQTEKDTGTTPAWIQPRSGPIATLRDFDTSAKMSLPDIPSTCSFPMEGALEDATSNGITAYCAPSTQDLTHTNPGGQTYFPSSSGAGGGTCSGEDEGDECVWSITVPSTCAYEEGGPYCVDNDNHDTVCPEMESVLKYYENTKNDPPPITPIHDITIHNNGTVGFKVKNPFESDLHDIYTVYHSSDGKGDEVCEKEMSAMECPQDKEFTALCMDDGAWTFITIFATGLDANSGAATLVSNHEGGSQGGSDVYACCPTSGELSGHLSKEYTAAWSYLIHCHCEEEETPQRALLQVSNDLVERFQRGELFDDELKQIYGISN